MSNKKRERQPAPPKTTSPERADATLPAVHALHLLTVVQRCGVTEEELLQSSGLSRERLADPAARISIAQAEELITRALRLTGEPALGYHLGRQLQILGHGHLGLVTMTAGTVRDALELAIRFTPTRTDALALHLRVEDGVASLVLEERVSLGRAREVIVTAVLVAIASIGKLLMGFAHAGSAEMAFPQPRYLDHLPHLRGKTRFGQPEHRLCFAAEALDLPLVLADPVAQEQARLQCERDLDALRQDRGLFELRALLAACEQRFPSMEEMAARLRMAPRTLARRLAAQGTSYSDLLDEVRRQRAEVLLRAESLSIDEVAERLGYSDAANFTRAFRRWTGLTPPAFRRARKAAPA